MKKTDNNPAEDAAALFLRALGGRIADVADLLGGKRALAQRLGVHESMLYRYIKGENALSAPLLVAIAEVGGVSLEWLATGSGAGPSRANQLREPGMRAYHAEPAAVAFHPVPRCAQSALQTHPMLAFETQWLHQLCGTPSEELCLIEMQGDSMEPTLRSGDLLLIDRHLRQVNQDGLYALQLADGAEIKRVQKRAGGGLLLGSDNPKCQPITLSKAAVGRQLRLIGRVVWFGRML